MNYYIIICFRLFLTWNSSCFSKRCTCRNASNCGKIEEHIYDLQEALESLFKNEYWDSDLDSSSHNVHENDKWYFYQL